MLEGARAKVFWHSRREAGGEIASHLLHNRHASLRGMPTPSNTVHWRTAYVGVEQPLFASLEPMGPVFATIRWVERPKPGWEASIRHRGWERRREAVFRTVLAAERAVERWAAAHETAIREALAQQNCAST